MTTIFITSGVSWSVPADWNNANNSITPLGSGETPNSNTDISNGGNGGGGGACSQIVNATTSGTQTIQVGAPGTPDTWVRIDGGGSAPTTTAQGVLAKGGAITGAGGAAASGVGTTKNSGGAGAAGNANGGGGGGGAAGLNGDGNAGGSAGGGPVGGAGGSGDNGSGGAGGSGDSGSGAGNGGDGAEWDASHGSGGGGGGSTDWTRAGGNGGNYGGGGGGPAASPDGETGASGGNGNQGLIVIIYTPASTFLPGDSKRRATLAEIFTTPNDVWAYHYLGGRYGNQPYGARQLPPSLIQVDNPPLFSKRSVITAEILTIVPNDVWAYHYLGTPYGRQPYGPRQLPPSIIAVVPVDNPPFNLKRDENRRTIIEGWQPPPPLPMSVYTGIKLPPALIQVDNPPLFSKQKATLASIFAIAPGDIWAYHYLGTPYGRQPYGPRTIPPSLIQVDNPPPFSEIFAVTAEITAFAWIFPPPLPTLTVKMSPGIPGLSVDNPPRRRGVPISFPTDLVFPQLPVRLVQAAVAVTTQPLESPPWLSTVLSAWQPVDPLLFNRRLLTPSLIQVDNPPFQHFGRTPNMMVIASSWQDMFTSAYTQKAIISVIPIPITVTVNSFPFIANVGTMMCR